MKAIKINELMTRAVLLLFFGLLFGCKPIYEKELLAKESKEATSAPAPPEAATKIDDVQSIQSLESIRETFDAASNDASVASLATNQAQMQVADDGNDVVKATPAIMRKVQQHLVNAGFNPGPVDGVSGAKTVAAIEGFQKQNNIPAGKLTKRTLRALESSTIMDELQKSIVSYNISNHSTEESEKALDDPFSVIDQVLKKLPLGNIAFNVPHEINIDETHIIQLVLGLEATIDELKQMIKAEDNKESANVRVSTTMEARLSGSNFAVTAITPEVQRISRSDATKWTWEIKPLKKGPQYLHLTLSALIDIDGKTTQRAIQTFDKKIEVEITGFQEMNIFLENNWQWLWAVILAPALGWLWKKKKES